MEITISRLKEIIKEEIGSYKNDVLLETPAHFCASHVRENVTGRTGRCIDHNWNETLQEVTAYDVDFGDEVIKNVPVSELTILEAKLAEEHAGHMAKRDDEVYEEAVELDEEVEELEEGGRAARGENADQGPERRKAGPGSEDRLHEEEEEEKKKEGGGNETFPDAIGTPGSRPRGTVDILSLAKDNDKTQKESLGIEEVIASQVDNILIEMGLMQPKKPLTLEEQIASLVDNYLPKVDEKALEETTFAYNEEKEEVAETKSLGDTIKEAVEEAVKAVVENNPVEPVVEEETEAVTEETEAVTEEAEVKSTLQEWYNNKKFEALKKKWAK